MPAVSKKVESNGYVRAIVDLAKASKADFDEAYSTCVGEITEESVMELASRKRQRLQVLSAKIASLANELRSFGK